MPTHEKVAAAADAIETEMKRIGAWDVPAPTAERMKFKAGFGSDTMAFEQWLKHVFLPRVRDLVRSRGEFPTTSMVGTQAIREFDGRDEAADLVSLLCEFDALFR